jgi:hypothetical protein
VDKEEEAPGDKCLGEVHQLISTYGAAEAKKMADSKLERQCFEAAGAVMGDDRFDLNVLHSGFAMTGLPHKSIKDLVWERAGGQDNEVTLLIESGHWQDKRPVGIPYGSVARLILIYLSSEAIANNSQVVELGSNMKSFLGRMGISAGGKSRQIVKDQSQRLSMCNLTFFTKRNRGTLVNKGQFVKNAFIPDADTDNQPSFWQPTVELDDAFFQSLKDHPLPLREAAIRQLSGRSMALDLYVFLSYRLHVLTKPTPVSWSALYQQFGAGFAKQWVFVQGIKAPLNLALAAYPEANVDITEKGLVLHPSESPVPKIHPRTGRLKLTSF